MSAAGREGSRTTGARAPRSAGYDRGAMQERAREHEGEVAPPTPHEAPGPGAARGGWRALLFPAEPRPLRGRRAWKIGLRAAHVVCAGVLVGAYVFDAPRDERLPWLAATLASGLAILALDLHESGAFLLQVRGLFVLAKVAVVALLPRLGGAEREVLGALAFLSVLVSHAPSKVRYFLVLGRGRVRGARSRG